MARGKTPDMIRQCDNKAGAGAGSIYHWEKLELKDRRMLGCDCISLLS